jgi:hypothetical protein
MNKPFETKSNPVITVLTSMLRTKITDDSLRLSSMTLLATQCAHRFLGDRKAGRIYVTTDNKVSTLKVTGTAKKSNTDFDDSHDKLAMTLGDFIGAVINGSDFLCLIPATDKALELMMADKRIKPIGEGRDSQDGSVSMLVFGRA